MSSKDDDSNGWLKIALAIAILCAMSAGCDYVAHRIKVEQHLLNLNTNDYKK